MIDLHCHLLPGVDDGAPDLATSLAMARLAVSDGIEVVACSPHFMPGLYDNNADDIRTRVAALNLKLIEEDINLALVVGCDAHIRPDFIDCLRNDTLLRLHDSRYVLFEPSHTTAPPRLDELMFNILMAGFVPVLTHPERFRWIEGNYNLFRRLVETGVWMQVTAGSLTGRFGKRAQYWGQKMLADGYVHIIATDAHDTHRRPPLMAEAFEVAAQEVGLDEARHLVLTRPQAILEDVPPEQVVPLMQVSKTETASPSFWRRMLRGAR
ncbi:MAG: capsular biosynthesis protein [Alphaproteobacteria bacterium]|nr:capsular biosynthesis protein [Alphaproteobacteria bacterium]